MDQIILLIILFFCIFYYRKIYEHFDDSDDDIINFTISTKGDSLNKPRFLFNKNNELYFTNGISKTTFNTTKKNISEGSFPLMIGKNYVQGRKANTSGNIATYYVGEINPLYKSLIYNVEQKNIKLGDTYISSLYLNSSIRYSPTVPLLLIINKI